MVTNTRDTTRTETVIYALIVSALAAAMVIASIDDLVPAWKFAAIEQQYLSVAKGEVSNDVALDALTRSLRASPNQSDLNRAAFVQLLRSQQLGIKSIRALPRLTAAKKDLRKGIAAAPADAFAWTRLAVAQLELGDIEPAAQALSLALQLAPAERTLTAIHFDLGVVLWDHLTPVAKQSLAQRLQWASHLPELANTLKGNSARMLRSKLTSSTN